MRTLCSLVAILIVAALAFAPAAYANHPVFVEGATDFDGDGLIGTAEDTDNSTDNTFGTITAALGALNGGANQNGRVIIVTTGVFPESITITALNGNVQLEAAPGVDANIDAVVRGLAGNDTRQQNPGIVVNVDPATAARQVFIRNITIRNWTIGIQVMGNSSVTVDGCSIANNIDHGILASDNARVLVNKTTVHGSGFRISPVARTTPQPGTGIEFRGNARGLVCDTTVVGSAGAGIQSSRLGRGRVLVQIRNVCVFDNAGGDVLGITIKGGGGGR